MWGWEPGNCSLGFCPHSYYSESVPSRPSQAHSQAAGWCTPLCPPRLFHWGWAGTYLPAAGHSPFQSTPHLPPETPLPSLLPHSRNSPSLCCPARSNICCLAQTLIWGPLCPGCDCWILYIHDKLDYPKHSLFYFISSEWLPHARHWARNSTTGNLTFLKK